MAFCNPTISIAINLLLICRINFESVLRHEAHKCSFLKFEKVKRRARGLSRIPLGIIWKVVIIIL